MMTYDRQILTILSDVGQRGISVQSLAKHIYNLNTTFFAQPDIEEIRSYVQQYLQRNSKSPLSLIERAQRRGFYRLNTQNNADARQLMLAFHEPSDETDDQPELSQDDESLSLFPDF
jgi:hypothetical protein